MLPNAEMASWQPYYPPTCCQSHPVLAAPSTTRPSQADAAKDAAQQLADTATTALDSFSTQTAASAKELKVKAAGSKDDALDAFDAFAEAAVGRMQKLGSAIIPGDAEVRITLLERQQG